MKSEIKDGLFTSTQTSILLGMNVQTLREWQRKKYLPLPDTGGWQRYSIPDILALSAMDHLLDTGLTYELAAKIAVFARPVLIKFMDEKEGTTPPARVLVSVNPNEDAVFAILEGENDLADRMQEQSKKGKMYTTQIVASFEAVYLSLFESLGHHVETDGPLMFWKTDGKPEK